MTHILKQISNRTSYIHKGQAYLLVMIFMLVGTLIATPLLTFMSSGLSNTLKYQDRTQELYAANAGVNEAFWNLKSGKIVLSAGQTLPSLDLLVDNIEERPNKKGTTVSIFCMDKNQTAGIYKITSTASSSSTSNTTIEAWVETRPLLMDYGLISSNIVKFKPGTWVDGSVAGYPYLNNAPMDEDQYQDYIAGRVDDPFEASDWPFNFENHYKSEPGVQGTSVGPIIDAGNLTKEIGPGLSDGDLVFTGNGGTLRLTGTIYVEGNLDLAKNKDFTLDLNYQTIYVTGDIYTPPGKPSITGSGCIIAEGEIYFQPNMASQEGDYVFVMSTRGIVHFQPNGNYSGTVAGNVTVEAWPGGQFTYLPPPPNLNFPGLNESGMKSAVHVITWNVSPPFSTTDNSLYISTPALPTGIVNTYYSQTLNADNGTPTYVFSIQSGSLPTGLSLVNGKITGTPTEAGISAFVIRVEDAKHHVATRSMSINIFSSASQAGLTVTTDLPTNIANHSATLNGSVTNMGTALLVNTHFECWTITANVTIPVPVDFTTPANLSSTGNFSASVTGLTDNKTYYYRAIGQNAITSDNVSGTDQAFNTLASITQPPIISNVTVNVDDTKKPTKFTVTGWLTSMGSATDVKLYVKWLKNATVELYEINPSGWNAADPPSLSKPDTFTFSVSNSPQWGKGTYYFRVAAVGNNGAGITSGAEITYIVK
jgi:hypothetical protein